MKHLLFLFALLPFSVFSQYYSVTGAMTYALSPNAGTGIEKIYLLNTLFGGTISYSSTASEVNFYKYTQSLSDKVKIPEEDISISSLGNTTTYQIANLEDSRGYLAEENGVLKPTIWIIDYSRHLPNLQSISVVEGDDKCETIKLLIEKSDDLLYFSNREAAPNRIDRLYTIEFKNQAWDEASKSFVNVLQASSAYAIGREYLINRIRGEKNKPSIPLIDTQFVLKGDQFGEYFGMVKQISSEVYNAIAIEAHIEPELVNNGIEQDIDAEKLEAPVEFKFSTRANNLAFYYTWLVYHKSDMKNPIVRYTEENMNYTFTRSGDYEIHLEVANNASSCADSAVYTFSISDTFLDAPNFFSPGDSPGVNDEFRVAHRSILKFRCTIFNRWGNKLFEFTDPNKGWDGKYGGKYVNPGVYFYVIEYEGTDAKKQKKAGSINIVRRK